VQIPYIKSKYQIFSARIGRRDASYHETTSAAHSLTSPTLLAFAAHQKPHSHHACVIRCAAAAGGARDAGVSEHRHTAALLAVLQPALFCVPLARAHVAVRVCVRVLQCANVRHLAEGLQRQRVRHSVDEWGEQLRGTRVRPMRMSDYTHTQPHSPSAAEAVGDGAISHLVLMLLRGVCDVG